MRMNSNFVGISIGLCLVILLGFAKPAHAYIDPGSGSYLFQMLIAGFLVAVFSVKSFLKVKILSFMNWVKKRTGMKRGQK